MFDKLRNVNMAMDRLPSLIDAVRAEMNIGGRRNRRTKNKLRKRRKSRVRR